MPRDADATRPLDEAGTSENLALGTISLLTGRMPMRLAFAHGAFTVEFALDKEFR